MAGNRTLKLSILADVDDLNKKLKAANGDVETSAGKLEKFGKVAGAAFLAAAAAAGAYAVKIGVDGVKAALADEQSQVKLASALENATNATKAQIAATEDSIDKMARATEGFYRRFYRTVRYNPEAVTRASLTYDGIAHSARHFGQTFEGASDPSAFRGLLTP